MTNKTEDKKQMKMVAFELPVVAVEALEREAEGRYITFSALIREKVLMKLSGEGKIEYPLTEK